MPPLLVEGEPKPIEYPLPSITRSVTPEMVIAEVVDPAAVRVMSFVSTMVVALWMISAKSSACVDTEIKGRDDGLAATRAPPKRANHAMATEVTDRNIF